MILCKIKGQVIATIKHKALDKRPIFIVQPLSKNGKEEGSSFLAIDTVQSGPGDTVLVCKEGSSCGQILKYKKAPINCVIAGIVDKIDIL